MFIEINLRKKLLLSSTLIYLIFLTSIHIIEFYLLITLKGYSEGSANLIPFSTIANYISSFSSYNLSIWFYNLFGIIVAFLPFGVLVALIIKNSYAFVFNFTLIFSTLLELLQYLFNVRCI
ncbi:VanZ family protein [Virgibacillus salarius]|uniref:VanZ family protein n=1 Tax=Virgibacillus salarius TaxID=447199 RepID=UPI003CD0E172